MQSESINNQAVTIKEVSDYNYVNEIADIHIKTFKNFFLTFLGKGFLRQLYKGFMTHDKSGVLVAFYEERPVGFLAYSYELSDFYKYLIKKKLIYFMWYGMGALIRKPKILFRLFRALLKPGESASEDKYMEISSIGVTPELKNMHIGTSLIEYAKSVFDSDNYSYIKLETDAIDNESANEFYKRRGFELVNEYQTHEGRKMNEYHWSR